MEKRRMQRSRPGRALVAIALGAWMVGLGSRNAAAEDTTVVLDMPVVLALALDGQSMAQQLHDAKDVTDAGVIEAQASTGGGSGEASVGLVDVVKARARAAGSTGGTDVYMEFTVDDPENRPEIKTRLHFKGVVATIADSLDTNHGYSGAWNVRVALTDGAPFAAVVHDDRSMWLTGGPHQIGDDVFKLDLLAESGNGGACQRWIEMHGEQFTNEFIAACTNAGLDGTLDLTHAPGHYLMHSVAVANGYGVAIGDPVWEPHPDYPEVVITRHAPPGLPRAPLGDTTPEELAADGIDPTLFVEAGFFTDPTPFPTSTPAHAATPIPTVTPAPAPADSKKCDPAGADAAAIAAARARIDVDCPCDDYDGSKGNKHGDYVHCATETVKTLIAHALLKKSCKNATRKCAASSTCGSPGFVTCQLTTARHQAKCAIKTPDRCVAPRGGDARLVDAVSCCDVE